MAIFNSYVKLPEGIIVIIHELGNSWCADSADSTEKPRRSWGFSTSSRLFWTSECKRKSKCGQLEFPLRTIPVISWWWETTPERQTCPCTFLSRETSWNVLKHLETSWHILIHLETFWDILRHLETSWDILKPTKWDLKDIAGLMEARAIHSLVDVSCGHLSWSHLLLPSGGNVTRQHWRNARETSETWKCCSISFFGYYMSYGQYSWLITINRG